MHQDHLTGTSLLTDSSGDQVGSTMKYLPFGETRSGSVPTDKLFTGQRLDSTGLYYYNARYYDPTIGRFISPDTIVQDYLNPQALNRYTYVLNNPLKYIDPTGNIEVSPNVEPDWLKREGQFKYSSDKGYSVYTNGDWVLIDSKAVNALTSDFRLFSYWNLGTWFDLWNSIPKPPIGPGFCDFPVSAFGDNIWSVTYVDEGDVEVPRLTFNAWPGMGGYFDLNVSIGYVVGLTGGFMVNDEGIYPYLGAGEVWAPGFALSYSPQDPTPGLNVAFQGGLGVGVQRGYSYPINHPYWEYGVVTLGASATDFYVWEWKFPPGLINGEQ